MHYVGLKDGIPFHTQNELDCPHDSKGKLVLSDVHTQDDGVRVFTTNERVATSFLLGLKVVPKKVSVPKKKTPQ